MARADFKKITILSFGQITRFRYIMRKRKLPKTFRLYSFDRHHCKKKKKKLLFYSHGLSRYIWKLSKFVVCYILFAIYQVQPR